MQTLTLDVTEDYLVKFMNVLEALPDDKVKIKDDLSREIQMRILEYEEEGNTRSSFEQGLEAMKQRVLCKHANK